MLILCKAKGCFPVAFDGGHHGEADAGVPGGWLWKTGAQSEKPGKRELSQRGRGNGSSFRGRGNGSTVSVRPGKRELRQRMGKRELSQRQGKRELRM